MKIENELERLLLFKQELDTGQEQAELDPTKFSRILAGQLLNQEISENSKNQILQSLADPTRLLNIGLVNLAGMDTNTDLDYEQTLMSILTGYDGLLNGFESYAGLLSMQGGTDLRRAWGFLNFLDSQTGLLQSELQSINGDTAGLDRLFSELEVLIATEQFKFNRGDYQ